ncbi:hypothetical protein JVT61DRAFT_8204 [Boletus reticuloceps]|uniref:Uncharacterized protein n=1 Tax=Boletus reticuloceps TaxID=495285 RepID=A0A8I2YZQ9_9AGAM|nr:hypothetical protein JVT61DRAFT_8204 [Boletus reticuloceps]
MFPTVTFSVPSPSPSSIAHRESIARLLTPLRRIRPTVAYYQLAAHRIPTLWTLYRGLQRHGERENVKWRIRTLFEAKRHTIQAHVAKAHLERAYQVRFVIASTTSRPSYSALAQWLDKFVRAKQGDAYLQAVLDRYDRMITSKRERRVFGRLVREALEDQARLRTRTIFKGSFMRPTLYHRLLPRLVPQPVSISCMINKRRLRRERRYGQSLELMEWIKDLQMESAFEKQLRRSGARIDRVFSDDLGAWPATNAVQPLRDKLRIIQKANAKDYDRLYSDYSPKLLLSGVRARHQKTQYRARRHVRERAGEVFPSTLARIRQGPPAHVLAKMTPEERRSDKIVRSPSEAGYTASVKMKMRRKLKDGETWRMEDGREEEWVKFERLEEEVREVNMRRWSGSMDGIV